MYIWYLGTPYFIPHILRTVGLERRPPAHLNVPRLCMHQGTCVYMVIPVVDLECKILYCTE